MSLKTLDMLEVFMSKKEYLKVVDCGIRTCFQMMIATPEFIDRGFIYGYLNAWVDLLFIKTAPNDREDLSKLLLQCYEELKFMVDRITEVL